MRLAESPNNSAETRALRCPAQDDEETAAARALSGKVGTGFPKRSCSNKKIERDDDSKKSHPALADFKMRGDRILLPPARCVSPEVGIGCSRSPPGQNSRARKSARLTSAPTIVPCCSSPSDQAGILPATSLSTMRIAIHAGMTQTGSHPISLMRIDCSVKVIHANTTPVTISGHAIRPKDK